jgi:hypothetical protein
MANTALELQTVQIFLPWKLQAYAGKVAQGTFACGTHTMYSSVPDKAVHTTFPTPLAAECDDRRKQRHTQLSRKPVSGEAHKWSSTNCMLQLKGGEDSTRLAAQAVVAVPLARRSDRESSG